MRGDPIPYLLAKTDGEWAGKMHDDLLDAVQWAVAEGVTTDDQVAIMGGSYGGYATAEALKGHQQDVRK